MSNRSIVLIALALLLLNACATQQGQWRHNQLTGQAAQQQLAIDTDPCLATARNVVGPPPATQTPRDTVTTFSGYSSSGGYVRGEARTTTQSGMYGAPVGIQQSDMQNQYANTINSVFLGCMRQRGWTWQ